jgi:hypothetical protein
MIKSVTRHINPTAKLLIQAAASIITLILPLSATAAPNFPICHSAQLSAREVFSLAINMTFTGKVAFSLCEERGSDNLFLLSENQVGDTALKSAKTALTAKQYKEIKALFDKALKFDIQQDERAITIDGSTWCLQKFRGYLNLDACFWSPKDDMKKRKTEGLFSLGKALVKISGLDREFPDLE